MGANSSCIRAILPLNVLSTLGTFSFVRSRFPYLSFPKPEPVVSIKGAPEMYVKHGSPVTLHCQISSFIQNPAHVEWHLNGTVIAQVKNHPFAAGQQQRGKNPRELFSLSRVDTIIRIRILCEHRYGKIDLKESLFHLAISRRIWNESELSEIAYK